MGSGDAVFLLMSCPSGLEDKKFIARNLVALIKVMPLFLSV